MGHLRLGRLPKTQRWNEVIQLLETAPDNTLAIAEKTLLASEGRLRELAHDPSLAYSFWLLVRVTQAARAPNFAQALSTLGLPSDPETSTLTFISAVADRLRQAPTAQTASGPFAELASLALRRTLSESIGLQGPSFFGSSLNDLQHGLLSLSTEQQFGRTSQRFFGDFLSRTLTHYIDRELSNHLGGPNLRSVAENQEVKEAIGRHAVQSARILQEFAAQWYARHHWESGGAVSEEETRGFVAYALRKLRAELKQEARR